MASISTEQFDILMRPLSGSRVAKRAQAGLNLSYLEAWDVKAHLTRIFGFGNWDGEVIESHLVYEDSPHGDNKNYRVGYRVTYQLTIRDQHGEHLCRHTETAVGSARLPDRGEAHDMSIKTAESDALKRAAINLGTQFGLSLYNNGSTADVIKAVVVRPVSEDAALDALRKQLTQDAPGTPENGPESDEQPAQGSGQGYAPMDLVLALEQAATLADASARILSVASFKETNREYLDHLVEINGQDITLARHADLIAAGAYASQQEQS